MAAIPRFEEPQASLVVAREVAKKEDIEKLAGSDKFLCDFGYYLMSNTTFTILVDSRQFNALQSGKYVEGLKINPKLIGDFFRRIEGSMYKDLNMSSALVNEYIFKFLSLLFIKYAKFLKRRILVDQRGGEGSTRLFIRDEINIVPIIEAQEESYFTDEEIHCIQDRLNKYTDFFHFCLELPHDMAVRIISAISEGRPDALPKIFFEEPIRLEIDYENNRISFKRSDRFEVFDGNLKGMLKRWKWNVTNRSKVKILEDES